jgi:hypothetical protein
VEIEVAQEVCPRWSDEDIVVQWGRFPKWCREKNRLSDKWPDAWRSWCQTGKEKGWGGKQPRPEKPVQQPEPNVSKTFDVQDDYVQEMIEKAQEEEKRRRNPYAEWSPDDDRETREYVGD